MASRPARINVNVVVADIVPFERENHHAEPKADRSHDGSNYAAVTYCHVGYTGEEIRKQEADAKRAARKAKRLAKLGLA